MNQRNLLFGLVMTNLNPSVKDELQVFDRLEETNDEIMKLKVILVWITPRLLCWLNGQEGRR